MGYIDNIKRFIKKNFGQKADANIKDKDVNKLLHHAVESGNLKMVKRLIDKKADVNIKDEYGNTPLHNALISDISKGSNLNYKTRKRIIKILLENGANPNMKDVFGNTSLHLALMKGYNDIARTLIEKGANINIKNKNNETPLDCAHIDSVLKKGDKVENFEVGYKINTSNKEVPNVLEKVLKEKDVKALVNSRIVKKIDVIQNKDGENYKIKLRSGKYKKALIKYEYQKDKDKIILVSNKNKKEKNNIQNVINRISPWKIRKANNTIKMADNVIKRANNVMEGMNNVKKTFERAYKQNVKMKNVKYFQMKNDQPHRRKSRDREIN